MTPSVSVPVAGVIELAFDWPVQASVQRLWSALFQKPEDWWPQAYRAGGADAVMTFDCRLGGQLREDRSDGGGAIWYTAFALDPLRSFDLVGDLAARYGGPATSTLHVETSPGEVDGTSILKLTDSIVGRIGPEMRVSVGSGWQAIIGEGLVKYLANEDSE